MTIECALCNEGIKEVEIPDIHHVDGNHNNNKKSNKVLVHHTCHMMHHGIYPKNYNSLRQLTEAKEDIQKTRMRLSNQVDALSRLGFESNGNQDEMFKLMKREEGRLARQYGKIVEGLPIWNEWLVNIHGVGPDIAGQVISMLGDIKRFERISNLWSYSGYGLYDDKFQSLHKGHKHNYNTRMRCLMYKLVTNGFIMHKKDSYYGKLYDEFKRVDREKHPEKVESNKNTGQKYSYTDMHIHLRAIRKVAKVFLKDLWLVWRDLEELPIEEPYEVQYLGHTSHSIPHYELKM